MDLDGTFTGVVDRIEDGETVVVLLEDEGETVEQLDLDVDTLPEEGQHEGAVFETEITDGELVGLDYRPEREQDRRERLQEKFDRLSKRLDDSS